MAQGFITADDPGVIAKFATTSVSSIEVAEVSGQNVFRLRSNSFDTLHKAIFTDMTPSDVMEVLCTLRAVGDSYNGGGRTIMGVAALALADEYTHYTTESSFGSSGAGDARLYRHVNGSTSLLASAASDVSSIADWHHVKISVSVDPGDSAARIIRVTRWSGSIDSPPSPQIQMSVAAANVWAGLAGFTARHGQGDAYYQFLAYGTDGDPAPTSAGGGGGDDYDAELTAPAAAMQAQALTVEERAPYIAELTAPGVGMAGQEMTQMTGFSALLSAAGVAMTGMSAERRTGVNQQLTAPGLGLSPQPVNTVATQSYVAELSAAALQVAGQAVTWSASFIAELSAAAFSAIGRAATWTGPFVAALLPASLSMQGRQAEQRTGLIQQLSAGAFGFTAQTAQQVATFTAMLQAAALAISSQTASAMTSFAAQLTAPALHAEATSAEYSSTLSYVAELTAAVFKSTPTDLLVLRAYIADLTAAIFSMRARATEVEGVAEKVRRFMKTWRRRGRRL